MTSGLMAVVDALSRYIFSLLQSYEISIMYSPISIVNFNYFVKKVYDERFLSLLAFVLVLNGCDDGDLIQDINFQDIATASCTTNDIIFKLKKRMLLEIPKVLL
jgi:hypothetical protein